MEQNFEQNIPVEAIIAGFVVLFILSKILQKKLRARHLRNQGQISSEGTKVHSIEERVAANKEWASGKIYCSGGALMYVLWVAALVWNLTFGVSFIKMLPNPETPLGGKVMLGLFSLGGPVFIFFAVRATIRRFRYGKSWCCITGKAGQLGKVVSGKIFSTYEVAAKGPYTIILQCVETYYVGSGKNRRSETLIHWQDKQLVQTAGISSRAGIPFSIAVPPTPPETGYQLARGQINWQVTIDAPTEGVDYAAIFVVPVFKLA